MTSILDIILQGKRDLLRGEIAMTQRMLAAYELVWLEVERQLLRLEDNLLAADGLEPEAVQAWLRQQDWYRQLMASVEAQFARFNTDAASVLGRTQVEAVGVSRDASGRIRRWITDRAGSGFVADVRPQVFERWISATLPDSPLRASIERHGVEAAKVIEQRMTEGIGSGKGVRSIVRSIVSDLGMDSPKPYELTTLVRTETMRAYRGSFRDDMVAMGSDIVPEMEWLAAHSARTCPACLAMDGQRFPLDGLIDKFHVACRCVWRPVINEDIVPGANPPRKLGAQWFAEQDEETQRKILRSSARFEAYQDGVPLSEMVGDRGNPVWGPSVYVKPVRDLRIPEALTHPANPAVRKGKGGIWGSDVLPVTEWEVPEERRVLPDDIVQITGAVSPVARVDIDTRNKQIRKHREQLAQWQDFDATIAQWEWWRKQAPEEARDTAYERWQFVQGIADGSGDPWPLLTVVELQPDGTLKVITMHRRRDSYWNGVREPGRYRKRGDE